MTRVRTLIATPFPERTLTSGMTPTAKTAPAAAIEMAYLTFFVYCGHYGWRTDGYEYVLMWGLVLFAIALRGGGPYSLDRKLRGTL